MLDPGTIVNGQYRVIGTLGKGVHGSVYEVEDFVFGRLAMKVFADSPSENLAVTLREAQLLGGITHDHIVRVFNAGVLVADGKPHAFLTTALLPHGSLESLMVRETRLPNDQALLVTSQLLDALCEIHSRTPALIHRDIIPSNIFVASRNPLIVKLGDFAIALEASSLLGRVPVEGVIRYLAPEARYGYMNAQTDLYAVAIILYQLLTGAFPYPEPGGKQLSIREQSALRQSSPPAPSSLRRSLGPGVDGLVLRALAPRPQDRFPDAAAFRQACLAVLEMEG